MSIILTVLDHQRRKVLMAGDKRECHPDGTYHDTYAKVRALTNHVLIGFTGFVPVVMNFEKVLRESGLRRPSEIVDFAEEYVTKSELFQSTCTMAGLFDDGNIFAVTLVGSKTCRYILTPDQHGEVRHIKYFINSDEPENDNNYDSAFQKLITDGLEIGEAMKRTIFFASQRSSRISSVCDLAEISATRI